MMKKMRSCTFGLLLLAAGANAQALTVAGATVDFSFDDTLLGLLGNYSVTGDTLKFDPVKFTASANSINRADMQSAVAPAITITGRGGQQLSQINFSERGSFNIIGKGDAYAMGTVEADGDVRDLFFHQSNLNGIASSSWFLSKSFVGFAADSATVKLDNALAALINDDTSLSRIALTGVSFQASVVPLPAGVWLLGSAMLGLVGLKRRSRG